MEYRFYDVVSESFDTAIFDSQEEAKSVRARAGRHGSKFEIVESGALRATGWSGAPTSRHMSAAGRMPIYRQLSSFLSVPLSRLKRLRVTKRSDTGKGRLAWGAR